MGPEHYSEANSNERVGRVDETFRYADGVWPEVIEWRGDSFVLHYDHQNGTATYDAAEGPHGGVVIVDRNGYVIGGRNQKFASWERNSAELDD